MHENFFLIQNCILIIHICNVSSMALSEVNLSMKKGCLIVLLGLFVTLNLPNNTVFCHVLSIVGKPSMSRGAPSWFHRVSTNLGLVFLFVLGINQVSNWVYACMLARSYFFKNSKPLPISHFLKINTHPYLMTNDLEISNIHKWTQFKDNNIVGCFSKAEIKNLSILRLCYLQKFRLQRKKNLCKLKKFKIVC